MFVACWWHVFCIFFFRSHLLHFCFCMFACLPQPFDAWCMLHMLHVYSLAHVCPSIFFICSLNRLNSAVIPHFAWETILLKAKCCMALHKAEVVQWWVPFFSLESSRLLRVCLSGLTGWWRLCIFRMFCFCFPLFLWLVEFFFFFPLFLLYPGVNLARQPVSRLLVRFDLIRSACKFLSAFHAFLFPCPIPPSFVSFESYALNRSWFLSGSSFSFGFWPAVEGAGTSMQG